MTPEHTPEQFMEMAWKRYHTEPIFHARVYHAARMLKQEIKNTGMPWSESFDGVLTAGAAAGLLMADIHDPETGEFIDLAGTTGATPGRSERTAGPEPTAPPTDD